ncbi:hypothetical protein [Luteimonas fraxinea]|uniref:Uncharacterized protein n=1 Tax=Luteimonas fraxinea TaxID=2901869 RepID=A0ABS8UE66_9GAMM|nr:hypothetical protein [Luteimonas fraxinea]MCD9097036.1 hypothetical protein [Luteimonas fraxinea]
MDPYTWVYIIVMLLSIAISLAMMPKPQNAKPPALADFDAPVSEDGRDVAWLHGECWMKDPNVLWWGRLRTTPIRTKSGK